MLRFRIAPLAVAAVLGLAFASACDGEPSVAQAVTATATGPEPSGQATQWIQGRRGEAR